MVAGLFAFVVLVVAKGEEGERPRERLSGGERGGEGGKSCNLDVLTRRKRRRRRRRGDRLGASRKRSDGCNIHQHTGILNVFKLKRPVSKSHLK